MLVEPYTNAVIHDAHGNRVAMLGKTHEWRAGDVAARAKPLDVPPWRPERREYRHDKRRLRLRTKRPRLTTK